MKFFDRIKSVFKREKEVTSEEIEAMMQDIRQKFNFVEGIKDDEIKRPQARTLVENINSVYHIVYDMIGKVEKRLDNARGATWWATKEAHATDARNLQEGLKFLVTCKAELDEKLRVLTGAVSQKEDESEIQFGG